MQSKSSSFELADLAAVQEQSACSSSSSSTSSPCASNDVFLSSICFEQVDSFLLEALNSRNRLTVLRTDQDIQRFMRNPKQHHLKFRPLSSSYERLVVHRVARHYHLQSMATDCGASKGSCIILVKTPESRIPEVCLMNIPVQPVKQYNSTSDPPQKFAIKQREVGISGAAECISKSCELGNTTSVKTMEERKEEYDKARARIFNSNMDPRAEESVALDDVSALKLSDRVGLDNLAELVSAFDVKDTLDDDVVRVMKSSANSIAIFRDQEKDRGDPDYDRQRYSQQLNSDTGVMSGYHGMHVARTPFFNVSNDYMHSDGFTHVQASYVSLPHHLGGQWGPLVSSMQFYQDGFYGPFMQGQTPATHMYFATPMSSHPNQNGYVVGKRFSVTCTTK